MHVPVADGKVHELAEKARSAAAPSVVLVELEMLLKDEYVQLAEILQLDMALTAERAKDSKLVVNKVKLEEVVHHMFVVVVVDMVEAGRIVAVVDMAVVVGNAAAVDVVQDDIADVVDIAVVVGRVDVAVLDMAEVDTPGVEVHYAKLVADEAVDD